MRRRAGHGGDTGDADGTVIGGLLSAECMAFDGHSQCFGDAWDVDRDVLTDCECLCHPIGWRMGNVMHTWTWTALGLIPARWRRQGGRFDALCPRCGESVEWYCTINGAPCPPAPVSHDCRRE